MNEKFSLQNISFRALRVVQRNSEVYRRGWWVKLLPPLLEPVIYITAFGFGFGTLIGVIHYQGNPVSYMRFMAPGILALTVMYWAYFENTYGTYVRMEFQKTFQAIVATPLLTEDIIVGEWLWGTTKTLFAILLMLTMLSLMNLVQWPSAILVFPIAALGALFFSALGLITAAISPDIEYFNLPVFILIMPMFVVSGTFFPIDILPKWAFVVAQALPLTHVSALIRGACLGITPQHALWSWAYLLIATPVLSLLSFRLIYKKMVK